MSKLPHPQNEDASLSERAAAVPADTSYLIVQDLGSVRGKMLSGMLVLFAFYACYAYAGFIAPRSLPRTSSSSSSSSVAVVEGNSTPQFKPVTPSLGYSQQFEQSWSQYSPYFPRDAYKAPPEGCTINQVCN